jgi:hypothetical protein
MIAKTLIDEWVLVIEIRLRFFIGYFWKFLSKIKKCLILDVEF